MMTSTPSYLLKNYQVLLHHYQLLITPTPEPSTPSSVPSAPTPVPSTRVPNKHLQLNQDNHFDTSAKYSLTSTDYS